MYIYLTLALLVSIAKNPLFTEQNLLPLRGCLYFPSIQYSSMGQMGHRIKRNTFLKHLLCTHITIHTDHMQITHSLLMFLHIPICQAELFVSAFECSLFFSLLFDKRRYVGFIYIIMCMYLLNLMKISLSS